MLKKILVGSDLSSRSDLATRRAFLLARQHHSAVLLIHVTDDDQPRHIVREEVRQARRFLEKYYGTREGEQRYEVEIRVETGVAFEVISRLAATEAPDLIVMGAHRKRVLADMFVGTTVERVMRASTRPVLMVNLPPRRRYRSVIAAVDFSDASRQAIIGAARLGLLEDAVLAATHAFVTLGKSRMTLAGLDDAAIEDQADNAAAEAREQLSAFFTAPELQGLEPQLHVVEGTPARAIEQLASRLEADLVIAGTRNRSLIGRMVLGSVAEEILRRLPCDVLAVPPA